MTDPSMLLPMVAGYIPAKVLQTIAELGVPDHLAGGGRTAAELAGLTGTHAPSLTRVLRAAAVFGVVSSEGDEYALTGLGELLRSDVPGSLREFAVLTGGHEAWRSWGELAYSVRTGEPAFEAAFGTGWFDHLDAEPEKAARFARAMASATALAAPDIAGHCDLTGIGTLADIGGGNGLLLSRLLVAHPELKGVLADSAAGLNDAARVLAEAGVADRCEVVPTDFFDSVPAGLDAYLLKSIVHDWPDERAGRILANCHAAMRPDSVLLLVELVLPGAGDPVPNVQAVMSDLNLMVGTGGRERTEAELHALLAANGFEPDGTTPCGQSGFSVLRARPAR
ncbi:methyltransferase [Amycolatopsis magusensis]|uniref:methyltransferase n=1 Tax=Amycolatopsis magusensis TaxID=882444 RepID=UPI003C2CF1C3